MITQVHYILPRVNGHKSYRAEAGQGKHAFWVQCLAHRRFKIGQVDLINLQLTLSVVS